MKLILATSCFVLHMLGFNTSDLDSLRNSYPTAVRNKQICKMMIESLSRTKASPIHRAYLGGFRTIWAKHTLNPITKLSTFNKGKKDIEEAVQADPSNIEIRFIRLSVQKNCPAFLGYHENIEADTKMLSANIKTVQSPMLQTMVYNLLKKK